MGFFNASKYQNTRARVSTIPGCGACGLKKTCKSPKLKPFGRGEKGIMFIGESPSYKEDKSGKPMSGSTGVWLKNLVKKLGYDLERDCVKVNAVCCHKSSGDVTDKEVEGCRPHLLKLIDEYRPKVIIPLGRAAVDALIGHRLPSSVGTIEKWRGWTIPDPHFNSWICPTFHPAYIERSKKKMPYVEKLFAEDIKKALKLYRRKLPAYKDPQKAVKCLTKVIEIERYLKDLIENPPEFAAFDYETTGLKPHRKGHKIVSCAISTDGVTAVAFPFLNRIKPAFKAFLKSDIGKIAANMKFEEIWSRVKLDTPVNNWYFDTMLGAHCLDNRPGITSLKFQAYVQYGIIDYDSHIEKYLKADDQDNSNAFNRIHELHTSDLLVYNGVDAMLEYRLAFDQLEEFDDFTIQGYDLLHDGSIELAEAECNGMCVDVEYCEKQDNHLERKIAYMERKLLEHSDVREWKKVYRSKFNLDSNDQLADMLFNKLGYKAEVFTGKKDDNGNDKPSVSQEALEQVKSPLVKELIDLRRLKKAKSTYLANYVIESVCGILHPFFHLHTVRTFRSSSSRINFQNQPTRIPEIKKLVRRAVRPRPGHMICEIDYGGVEVKAAACYHKDPNMIAEINDPSKDMHWDMAKECFLLSQDECTKAARQATKGGFVFAQFYGDYYGNNAKGLWAAINTLKLETAKGVPMKKHLASKGIKNLKHFTNHLEKVEKYFWGTKFRVYGKWKEKHYDLYKERGYVDILTGFRCKALMGRNDAINYPIQGAAFHCLLWSFIQLSRWLRETGKRTKIIGQIHDSLVLDIHPDEANEVLAKAVKIMTVDIRKHWKWIIVPLEVDAELTPVDGSWYLKKEVVENKCSCGMDWRYENKTDSAVIYTCPVCGKSEEFQK